MRKIGCIVPIQGGSFQKHVIEISKRYDFQAVFCNASYFNVVPTEVDGGPFSRLLHKYKAKRRVLKAEYSYLYNDNED